MAELHIPLQHGTQEAVDGKLLPQGWLARAYNMRFRKDLRLGSRYGYAHISGAPAAAVAAGNFGPKQSVYVYERGSVSSPATWATRRADGAYTTRAFANAVGTLGVPRRIPSIRNTKYQVLSSDCVAVGSYIFEAYQDADYSTGIINGVSLMVYEALSHAVVQRSTLGGTSARNVKICAIGNTVMVFWADAANAIKFFAIDSALISSTIGTVTTAAAGRAFSFDVAPLDGTHCLLVLETPGGVNLQVGIVDAAGAGTQIVNQAIANPAYPSVALGSSGNIVTVWNEGATFQTGSTFYRVDTTAGVSVVAKTSLDASATVVGFPVVGPNVTDDYTMCWVNAFGTSIKTKAKTICSVGFLVPACKPFTGPNNSCLAWMVSQTRVRPVAALQQATYKLVDLESPLAVTTKCGAVCEAVSCQLEALPGYYQTQAVTYSPYVDPRRFCVVVPTVLDVPSSTAFACLLPIINGTRGADAFLSGTAGADLVRIDSSPYADRLLPANINGQLLFSGPRVREFDGSQLYESGLADGPEYITAAGSATAGAMAPGAVYSYIIVYEWYDHGGRRHRSAPSVPVAVTLGGGDSSCDLTYSGPSFTDRYGGNGGDIGISAVIYRTVASGSVYYRISSPTLTVNTLGTALYLYHEATSDVDLITHEVLYTQGARGGLSGLLANDEPPPCRYLSAGNDRLMLGGLENPTEVRWSKIVFPGEPVQFSQDKAYRAHVDEEVTGVAALDGAWYIFTARSIWVVTGQGPDDSGAGSFADPVKLPSEYGCIQGRSIVETPNGIMFLGGNGALCMIPRGGGAPTWFAQAVRDSFADAIIMSAKVLAEEALVMFLCIDTAATFSFFMVYDLRCGEWTADITSGGVFTTPRHVFDVYDNKLVIDGLIAQTSSFTDNVDGSTPLSILNLLTTGDIRPFGPMGNGRVRKLALLAESRTTASMELQAFVSYDSGNSFVNESDNWTLSGVAVGTSIRKQHALKYPRGETFRFQFFAFPTSATVGAEGIVFNDISLEVFPSAGLPRMTAAERG